MSTINFPDLNDIVVPESYSFGSRTWLIPGSQFVLESLSCQGIIQSYINTNGELVICYSDDGITLNGICDNLGPVAGSSGVGIASIDVNTNGDLIIYYDDGSSQNAGRVVGSSGGSASVATDITWEANGDLIVGTAKNTAEILSKGNVGQFLVADSNETTGLKWVSGVYPSFLELGSNNTTNPELNKIIIYTTSAAGTGTNSQSITVPSGATFMFVAGCGGGGGGGSGRRVASDPTSVVTQYGGNGGQGGQGWAEIIRLSDLNSPTSLTLLIGAGGAGGTAITGAANGNAGSGGGNTTIQNSSNNNFIARFAGGQGGAGGSSTTGTTRLAVATESDFFGTVQGYSGSAGVATLNSTIGGSGLWGGGGGGAGGCVTYITSLSLINPSDGGIGGAFVDFNLNTSDNFDYGAQTTSQNGSSGSSGSGLFRGGGGGSGGMPGSASLLNQVGGSGGSGGYPGGGGGGGGAATGVASSGAGGNGADGYVVLAFW